MPDNEAAKYLAGYMLNHGARATNFSEPVKDDADAFVVHIPLSLPAILGVKSENFEGMDHAVVWDSERRMVLDPLYDEPQPLARYDLVDWTPICPL